MEAALASGPRARSLAAAGCQVYWPAPYEVCGAIRDKYNQLGGPNSFLLWPTSNELSNPDGLGKRTTFQNGPIYCAPWAGAHPVVNHFFAAWQRQGWEGGVLGYPTTDEIVNPDGGGRRQEFDRAAIYWRLNEAYAIGGAIRDRWNAASAEQGPLGYPTSDELGVNKYSGRHNNFENGTIAWSGTTGSRVLFGAIRDRWAEVGREDGELGYPTSDELVAPDGVGHYVYFENGSAIYSLPIVGAWRVPPNMISLWEGEGFEGGVLGYPVENPRTTGLSDGLVIAQLFQHGAIGYTADNIAYVGAYEPAR
ncbi:hypothetical protein ACWF82_01985 [Nocardia sp. NPDC055053]